MSRPWTGQGSISGNRHRKSAQTGMGFYSKPSEPMRWQRFPCCHYGRKVTGKVLALVGVKPVGAESERTIVCSHKPVVDFVKADRRFIDAAPNGQRHTSCRFPADSQ